jgi:hypothetical protein
MKMEFRHLLSPTGGVENSRFIPVLPQKTGRCANRSSLGLPPQVISSPRDKSNASVRFMGRSEIGNSAIPIFQRFRLPGKARHFLPYTRFAAAFQACDAVLGIDERIKSIPDILATTAISTFRFKKGRGKRRAMERIG